MDADTNLAFMYVKMPLFEFGLFNILVKAYINFTNFLCRKNSINRFFWTRIEIWYEKPKKETASEQNIMSFRISPKQHISSLFPAKWQNYSQIHSYYHLSRDFYGAWMTIWQWKTRKAINGFKIIISKKLNLQILKIDSVILCQILYCISHHISPQYFSALYVYGCIPGVLLLWKERVSHIVFCYKKTRYIMRICTKNLSQGQRGEPLFFKLFYSTYIPQNNQDVGVYPLIYVDFLVILHIFKHDEIISMAQDDMPSCTDFLHAWRATR